MTPDEIAAERERFEAEVALQWPSLELDRDEYQYLDFDVQGGWEMWRERAEIARAEQAELTAEVERLREEVATLRELRVFDWKSKERLEKRLSKYEDVRYVTAQGQGEEVSVPADELDQLRAAAAELAEIKRAWGMAGSEL